MTAPHRPPVRPAALALLAALLVTGALGAGAVALAPDSVRTPLAWGAACAALAFSAVAAYAAHARESAARLRRSVTELRHAADRSTAEQARLIAEQARTTAELTEARDARAADADGLAGQLRSARAERAAALAACANAAGRMQALATGMLADLREMEHRHTDEDVLADLLHLDHRTAQAGRLADSVAVLTGARSGRRWARPIAMESILRGAMGRIGGYQRVRVHANTGVAVAGHAAEGVMHALAELLDNAANFSPPTAEVHVYVEEVPAGVIVSVEDSGLVMGPVQLRRAEHAVSGEAAGPTGLGGLSGTRLGLAVVGRLARKHGLTVSFRPSARGGTGVLLLIPQELLSRTPEPTRGPKPVPGVAMPGAAGGAPGAADAARGAAGGAARSVAHAAAGHEVVTHEPVAHEVVTHEPVSDESPAREAAAHEPAAGALPVRGEHGATKAPAPTPAPGDSGLPKRARGRTLAAAERAQARAAAGTTAGATAPARTTGPTEASETTNAKTEAAVSAAARFSSFRQAVRATTPRAEAPGATSTTPRTEDPVGTGTEDPVGTRTEDPVGMSTAPLTEAPVTTPTPRPQEPQQEEKDTPR
ncbi:ATP-binding protein [Streptomyces sp. NPDC046821]|uniref:sensor histidine kinase n=1 Tax=Streptomyces sp. NPDC046821 TaxID=3154702 RepID=UPI00340B83C2